jgi:hypothetical protein
VHGRMSFAIFPFFRDWFRLSTPAAQDSTLWACWN